MDRHSLHMRKEIDFEFVVRRVIGFEVEMRKHV